jgi:hypothetical protein
VHETEEKATKLDVTPSHFEAKNRKENKRRNSISNSLFMCDTEIEKLEVKSSSTERRSKFSLFPSTRP